MRLVYTENNKQLNNEINYIASFVFAKRMFEAGIISYKKFEIINLANACCFGVAPILYNPHICK